MSDLDFLLPASLYLLRGNKKKKVVLKCFLKDRVSCIPGFELLILLPVTPSAGGHKSVLLCLVYGLLGHHSFS